MRKFFSPENYFLVTIPPNIWNGFEGLQGVDYCELFEFTHTKEMVRLDIKNKRFNHNW